MFKELNILFDCIGIEKSEKDIFNLIKNNDIQALKNNTGLNSYKCNIDNNLLYIEPMQGLNGHIISDNTSYNFLNNNIKLKEKNNDNMLISILDFLFWDNDPQEIMDCIKARIIKFDKVPNIGNIIICTANNDFWAVDNKGLIYNKTALLYYSDMLKDCNNNIGYVFYKRPFYDNMITIDDTMIIK